ncbi:biotinidase-like protein [Lates japonicus]|uniref:Biotinidase-like protein n=1 Tax=Lates japonicus TaxID=270547 RepID=A0AAD3MHX6_LATJO|nr:biotinidase-like protein [Lates japonicus]
MTSRVHLSLHILTRSLSFMSATGQTEPVPGSTYVAAVYEHNVILNPNPRVSVSRSAALQHMQKNLDIYEEQAARAAQQSPQPESDEGSPCGACPTHVGPRLALRVISSSPSDLQARWQAAVRRRHLAAQLPSELAASGGHTPATAGIDRVQRQCSSSAGRISKAGGRSTPSPRDCAGASYRPSSIPVNHFKRNFGRSPAASSNRLFITTGMPSDRYHWSVEQISMIAHQCCQLPGFSRISPAFARQNTQKPDLAPDRGDKIHYRSQNSKPEITAMAVTMTSTPIARPHTTPR